MRPVTREIFTLLPNIFDFSEKNVTPQALTYDWEQVTLSTTKSSEEVEILPHFIDLCTTL